MTRYSSKTKAAVNSIAALAVSVSLLVTVCFAPVMAQEKEQLYNDSTHSHRPIITGYLA